MFPDPNKTLDTRRPDIGMSYVSTNIGMHSVASGTAGEQKMGTKTGELWEGHRGIDVRIHSCTFHQAPARFVQGGLLSAVFIEKTQDTHLEYPRGAVQTHPILASKIHM